MRELLISMAPAVESRSRSAGAAPPRAADFLGVGVADVQRLASFLGHDGVDEVSGDAVAAAFARPVRQGPPGPSVISEVVAEDAGMALDLAVRQMRLRDVQRSPSGDMLSGQSSSWEIGVWSRTAWWDAIDTEPRTKGFE